MIVEAKTGLK